MNANTATEKLYARTRQYDRALDMMNGATYSQNRSDAAILRQLIRKGFAICTSPKRYELTAAGRDAVANVVD